MSTQTNRRARVKGVRATQLRIAEAELAVAERDRLALADTAERLMLIRRSLVSRIGQTSGGQLSNCAELTVRLDRARHDMARQIDLAGSRTQAASAQRLAANQRYQAAQKLHDRAAAGDALLRERQNDANHPFRKRPCLFGELSR
jgi:hypothetical protein